MLYFVVFSVMMMVAARPTGDTSKMQPLNSVVIESARIKSNSATNDQDPIISDCSDSIQLSGVTNLVTNKPITRVWLEGGFVSVGDQEWVTVSSSAATFIQASVFLSVPPITGESMSKSFPAVARVRNVIISGGIVTFDVRLYQANDSYCSKKWHVPQSIAPLSLSWMVAEHGAFNVYGNYFMVGRTSVSRSDSTLGDTNCPRVDYHAGCGGPNSFCAYPEDTVAGVLLQLQTLANDRLLIPRCKVVQRRFSSLSTGSRLSGTDILQLAQRRVTFLFDFSSWNNDELH